MAEGLGICALRCGCGVCICFVDRLMDGRSQVDVGAKDCNMIIMIILVKGTNYKIAFALFSGEKRFLFFQGFFLGF